ncbi:MAG: helix-turn-helix transcriptional regulator, partial [Bacteroides sp.]
IYLMELRVKEICKEKGVLMEELANKLGIARVNLTKTINGNPTIGTLERIAESLDIDFMDLFAINNKELCGYVEYKNTIYTIKSREDLEKLLKLVE